MRKSSQDTNVIKINFWMNLLSPFAILNGEAPSTYPFCHAIIEQHLEARNAESAF